MPIKPSPNHMENIFFLMMNDTRYQGINSKPTIELDFTERNKCLYDDFQYYKLLPKKSTY